MALPDSTSKVLNIKPVTPLYYRVACTDENGKKIYGDTTKVNFAANVTFLNETSAISAAQGYVEVNGEPGSGISIPGDDRDGWTLQLKNVLSNWSNANADAVYYIYHRTGTTDAQMKLTVASGGVVKFHLQVFNPTNPTTPVVDTYLALAGTGSEQTIDVFALAYMKTAGYYRYVLHCIQGNNLIRQINRWTFKTRDAAATYAASYLSSPSVHLSGWKTTQEGAPTGRSFDWCYEEIMIPQESNYVGTYAMSLGVLSGYMGIQVNGESRHDVIFSMWDDGSTDSDPGLPNYKKAGAVDASPDVTVSRFGNEGTGVKTFAAGDWWKPGTFVQFITNARPETATYEVTTNGVTQTIVRNNTLVTAWFNAQDGKGWQYIATTRLPGSGHYFDSWYSFLENYSWTSGQVTRKAFYRNGYIHGLSTKQWYHCNSVGFGHTDGGTQVGARTDYGQGQDVNNANTFFMTTGGYLATNTRANKVPLNTDNTPVDTINIDKLEARVDLAVAKEAAALEQAEKIKTSCYDKTGWEVISYSSEETSGEGTNGRAAEIIDGSTDTYWHSAWQSGSASLPHWFVIDTKAIRPFDGFQFNLSGGTSRHQKGIEIQVSNDNKTWHTVYVNSNCPDTEQYYLALDSTVNARYIKLIINTTQSGVVHTRINEINVTHPTTTGISQATVKDANGLTAYPNPATNYINVVAPVDASDILVEIFAISGERVLSQHIYNQVAKEVTQLSLKGISGGIYLISCTAGSQKFSRRIIIK
jgi:hypothetical protein